MNFKADIEAKIVLAPFLKKATLALVYVLVSLLFAAVTFAAKAAGEADAAGDASPCSSTVPFQIMAPGYTVPGLLFVDGLDATSAPPHFQAFVTAVMEHINSRLAREKLCINGAKSMESMRDFREKGRHHLRTEKIIGMNVVESMASMHDATWEERSLLQFVHWKLDMSHLAYSVPVMTSIGGQSPPSCSISSPWIDLAVYRTPVPQIRGIIYWNERQLLADQAVLAGARNVPPGRAMPLNSSEFGYFMSEYEDAISYIRLPQVESKKKPVEARVSPDILWLLHRSGYGLIPFMGHVSNAMRKTTEKGAEGYTKVVLTLIDRCFASSNKGGGHYSGILDVADPVLLKQYKIDTPAFR